MIITLTEIEDRVLKTYKHLRSIDKTAAALKKSNIGIQKVLGRLEHLGLLTRKTRQGPYNFADKEYIVVEKKPKVKPPKAEAVIHQPVPGSPCGPCIIKHISEYPEEEQQRMMSLFRPVNKADKKPVTTIEMDIRKKQKLEQEAKNRVRAV